MMLKCCTQYESKFLKLSSGHRTGKGQFSFQSQRKAEPKECSNYYTTALISHVSKVMVKILQARLQQYVNQNSQMFKLAILLLSVHPLLDQALSHSRDYPNLLIIGLN